MNRPHIPRHYHWPLLGVILSVALLGPCGTEAATIYPPHALPDPRSTPGAIDPAVTQANIHQTICVPGYSRTVRPPSWYTSKLKHRQLAADGIFGRMREFEEDHLIPISVGGNPRDVQNLWPEPRFEFWNAEKKDQLEDVMHRRVCDGSISLRAAQDAFRGNWTVAYRRYVPARQ